MAAWDNLMEAVEQASSYASNFTGPRPDKWLLVIVVNDAYADEQTAFRHITCAWQLLTATPLVALATERL